MSKALWIIGFVAAIIATGVMYAFLAPDHPGFAWTAIIGMWLMISCGGFMTLVKAYTVVSPKFELAAKYVGKFMLFLSIFLGVALALGVFSGSQFAFDIFKKYSITPTDAKHDVWILMLAALMTPWLRLRIVRQSSTFVCFVVALVCFIWPHLPAELKSWTERTALEIKQQSDQAAALAKKGLAAAHTVAEAQTNHSLAAASRSEQQLALSDSVANAKQLVLNQGAFAETQLWESVAHEPYEFTVTRDDLSVYEDERGRMPDPIAKGEAFLYTPSGAPTLPNPNTRQQFIRVTRKKLNDKPVCVKMLEVLPFILKAKADRDALLKQQESGVQSTATSVDLFSASQWSDLPPDASTLVHKQVTLKPGETSQEITVSVIGASSYFLWLPDSTTQAWAWIDGNEVKLLPNVSDLIFPAVQGSMKVRVKLSDKETLNKSIVLKVMRK